MFESFTISWMLLKASWEVIKKNREIMIFPILSSSILVLMFLLSDVGLFYLGAFFNIFVMIFGLITIYFMSYFVMTWCNVAIVGCATIGLKGGKPTVRDGARIATENLGSIIKWSLLSAIVGLIISAIRSRKGGARIVGSLLGAAWNVLTFFIIPVLIYEKRGVFTSLKRSGNLFLSTWAETIIGRLSLSGIFFLLALIGIIPIVIAFFTFNFWIILVAFLIAIIYWGILSIISGAMQMVFRAALYQYVTTGSIPRNYAPFTAYIPPPMYVNYNQQNYYKPMPGQYVAQPPAYVAPTYAPAPHPVQPVAPQAAPTVHARDAHLRPGEFYCKRCGAVVSADSIACERCGEGI